PQQPRMLAVTTDSPPHPRLTPVPSPLADTAIARQPARGEGSRAASTSRIERLLLQRILLDFARPDVNSREAILEESREIFDAGAFGGVVAGEEDGDVRGSSGQAVVETHLAGEEDVSLLGDRVAEELAGGAACERDLAHRFCRVADDLHLRRLQLLADR